MPRCGRFIKRHTTSEPDVEHYVLRVSSAQRSESGAAASTIGWTLTVSPRRLNPEVRKLCNFIFVDLILSDLAATPRPGGPADC